MTLERFTATPYQATGTERIRRSHSDSCLLTPGSAVMYNDLDSTPPGVRGFSGDR